MKFLNFPFFALLLCLLFTPILIFGQGIVKESLVIKSDILGKKVNYCVYLPEDYRTSSRSYPVVYLLHGYTDNETAWIQFGEVHIAVDQAIANRQIPPMIIVMPDAGVSWYINDHEGKVRYEDFFVQEFIPFIEKGYRIRDQKQFRGIAGLSMGGYGSLLFAMKYPDLFVASAPLSAAIYREEDVVSHNQDRWDRVEGVMYGKSLNGQDRITEHWKANNPFYLGEKLGAESLKKVKYYFDCGDDDFLSSSNAAFHIFLNTLDVPHEYRVREGAHNWEYWRTGIIDALQFIGKEFHR